MTEETWSVEIKINGESKLYISQDELGGVDNIMEYSEMIEMIIKHLHNFTKSQTNNWHHFENFTEERKSAQIIIDEGR